MVRAVSYNDGGKNWSGLICVGFAFRGSSTLPGVLALPLLVVGHWRLIRSLFVDTNKGTYL